MESASHLKCFFFTTKVVERDAQLALKGSKSRKNFKTQNNGEDTTVKDGGCGRGGRGKNKSGHGRGGRDRGGRGRGRGGRGRRNGAYDEPEVYFPSEPLLGTCGGDPHGDHNGEELAETGKVDVKPKKKPKSEKDTKLGKTKGPGPKDKSAESEKAGIEQMPEPSDESAEHGKAVKKRPAGRKDQAVEEETAGMSKASGSKVKPANKKQQAVHGGDDEEGPNVKERRLERQTANDVGVASIDNDALDNACEASLLIKDFGTTAWPCTFAGRYCPKKTVPMMKWEALHMAYTTVVVPKVPEGTVKSELQDGCLNRSLGLCLASVCSLLTLCLSCCCCLPELFKFVKCTRVSSFTPSRTSTIPKYEHFWIRSSQRLTF